MKKKLLVVILAITMILSGCSQIGNNEPDEYVRTYASGYFTVISESTVNSTRYILVYANDTGVKYMVMCSTYTSGITPLYNSDGTLQIYGEEVY